MQITVPLPSLSPGGYAEPAVFFEDARPSLAANDLYRCFLHFFKDGQDGGGIHPGIYRPEAPLPMDGDGVTVFEDGLTLVPYKDFSAILLREATRGTLPYEIFYHPLRLSIAEDTASPQDRMVQRLHDAKLNQEIRTNLDEIVDFWDANPTFDVQVNEGFPVNLAWAMPIVSAKRHIPNLKREMARLISAFPAKCEFSTGPAQDFSFTPGRLLPDGKIVSASIRPSGYFAQKNGKELAGAIREWVTTGLSSSCCPVPPHNQILNERKQVRMFNYPKELGNLSRHEIFETRARMRRLLQE